ncbi:MAG TPA: anhydro-N-acetylmuramic acid kinase [Burkholderiaceae bacterium]|nr:anhydro-N-acetylmuramic acid kinase [Burkholderiaceae bacterium]
MAASLYIGLMSGTSLDGVDGVLVDFDAGAAGLPQVLAHAHHPFADDLRAELLALNSPADNELHRAALAGNGVARCYAGVVEALLGRSGTAPGQVRAVGAHGQTVRHRPGEFDGTGYTLQLNSPALLAELCGIDVVADLRSRDVAAGGQGAPLAPVIHRALFARAGETVAVLNLGGIANLTVLRADGSAIGFDCGPANALMDHWCGLHTGRPYDDGGAWAAAGRVNAPLLARLRREPFFARPPPKSTGRDLFNPAWLQAKLASADHATTPVDVQATLAEFSAMACADDVRRHAPGTRSLVVCGGGASNRHVMARLAALLPGVGVQPSDAFGLPAEQVEACAFAWLARACVRRESGNLPDVTGARGARVLGAIYPAR